MRYFILDGRCDIAYCPRPLAHQPEKTCQDVGALNKYMDKVHAVPIRTEFHKAYKRNHSRVRVGSITQTEFLEWSDEARDKRDQCIAGEMDKDEFMEWTNQDRRYKKNQARNPYFLFCKIGLCVPFDCNNKEVKYGYYQ